VPSVPDGSAPVVMVSAVGVSVAVTVNATTADFVRAGLDESFTAMVMGKLPLAVGFPEMIPVPGARVSPAGSLPEEIDQVYGAVPPVAVRAFE
jgi:hypothetical protein